MNIQKLSSDAALAVGLVGLGASAIAGTVAVVATGTLPITLIVTAVASAALIAVGLVMRFCKETEKTSTKEPVLITDVVEQGTRDKAWKMEVKNLATQAENLEAIMARQVKLNTPRTIHQSPDESAKEAALYYAQAQKNFFQNAHTACNEIIQAEKNAFHLVEYEYNNILANLAYAKKLAERNAS